MVFRAKDAKTYKLRVDHPDGRHATLSTGCRDLEDARDVEAVVDRWRGRKGKRHQRLDVLDALIEKRVSLVAAIDAYHAGTLDELLEANPRASLDLRARVNGAPSPVEQWLEDKRKAKRGAGQAATYDKQLRVLFPEPTLPIARFTRKEVWERIDQLDVDTPTKNRYRAAASSLAKFLVKRELLERNFVRDIEGFGENDPRLVYYEIEDAKRLVAALAQPYAALAAAAVGFCMEWTALEHATVADFNLSAEPPIAHVRGTKRSWRDRYVPLVQELRWVLDSLRPALANKLPTALVFDAITEWRAIDVQRAAAKTLELHAIGEDEFGEHSIHDWRQTHAVALLRWGYSEQIAADHLGHKNTTLVRENYGRFRPNEHDYAKRSHAASAPGNSTNSTTTVPRRRGRRA